jgi:multiple sugar transport system substrate-binding protein
MADVSRRKTLAGTFGLAAAGALGRPHLASAQAKTAVVWVNQGYVPEEDEAFLKLAADYEKASGNKLDSSIMPGPAMNQKTIAALTSRDVPDLVFSDAPATVLPQNAWQDKIVDVTDVVDPFQSQLTETAKLASTFTNKVTGKRSYYLCPIKQGATPFHVWGDLVEKAGFKVSDIPLAWNARWDFFKPIQKELRAKGMRKIYAMGMAIETVGPNDGNNTFQHTVIAHGGKDIVTPDGKLNVDNPQVREAVIKTCEYMSTVYKEGFVPPEVFGWNDADDNNGFHEKVFVVDFDGTLSTELAMIKDKKAYDAAVTIANLHGNDGKPMPAQVNAGGGFIPKGAKNVAVAKDLMKYWMQPKVMGENLKAGLGRWAPAIQQIVKDDPWWLDPADPHRAAYIHQCVLEPTMPVFEGYTPAWGQVAAEQILVGTVADVVHNGMTPTAAVDKMFARAKQIFAQYTLG